MKTILIIVFSLVLAQLQMCGQENSNNLHAEIKGKLFDPTGFEVKLFSNSTKNEVAEFKVKFFVVSILSLKNNDFIETNFSNDGSFMKNSEYLKFITNVESGLYKVKIKDIICGPFENENNDTNSFRPLDLSFEVEKK